MSNHAPHDTQYQNDKRKQQSCGISAFANFGRGLLSWKKIASGKVAAGWSSEVGMLSVNPAVNMTPAASPMARPIDKRVAVAIPGAICRMATFMVS